MQIPPFLEIVAGAILLIWLASTLELAVRGRTRRLGDAAPSGPEAPSVSVVIAARNEAGTIEAALRTVLALEYAPLEVVVVNDRSSDGTGAILRRVAREAPELRVLEVDALPAGWLGKNHALSVGAKAARGEWILFTDADVHFGPSALAHGMGLAREAGVDHLAVAPRLRMRGVLLELFAGAFTFLFAHMIRPWRARDPRSRRHIGIGAFNLVRREAYTSVGGHAPIRMRPDDDLQLGKLLKLRGYRQDVAFGGDLVSVEWYSSLRAAARGLEKNTFSAFDYSLPRAALAGTIAVCVTLLPFLLLPFASGPAFWLSLGTCLLLLLLHAGSTRAAGGRPLLALLLPLAMLLVFVIGGRATALTLLRGGIRWRDTFYPLEELRRNRI